MQHSYRPAIAITIGDAAGVGPEIALKALQDPKLYAQCRPLLVGDMDVLAFYIDLLHLPLRLHPIDEVAAARFAWGTVDVLPVDALDFSRLRIGESGAMTGKAMLAYTDRALELALAGEVDAVVGGPHSKQAVEQAGIAFDGYPGYVAKRTFCKEEDVFLLLVAENFRVVNVTLHVSLRAAIDLIKKERVLQAIRAADRAVKQLGVPRPRIAVAGLNPHAGENGLFGREEAEEINPAITEARKEGIEAYGAFGSDTLFLASDKYDVFVAMYHDQAHIPIKLKFFHQITALTIGAPVLFASVGHGSAPDIAGKGIANPNGLVQAIKLFGRFH
ncbi:4-hydroxythreonine-4-phosphate dehydrogenase PdxA [Bacillaceae bacterium]